MAALKANLVTLGCKINRCESESLAKLFADRGYEVSFDEGEADVFVVNTCAVTAEADRKSRQTVHRLAKRYPEARILVLGCSSQHARDAFEGFENVTAVGGTYDKYRFVTNALDGNGTGDAFAIGRTYVNDPLQKRLKTREYVKVQDGCDRFCSYCLIPYLRGRSRSRSIDRVLEQTSVSTAKELVVTGIDLSSYGKDTGTTLPDLLRAIDHPRIRLGSLELSSITDEFLDAVSEERFCKHFHLSMQSGSDRVLAAMNRKYTSAEFLEKVRLIRARFPYANITTDCIAGFPTETEEEHRETIRTVRAAKFGAMHVFPYSVREGTRAAKLPQIPKRVRERRAKEIFAVSEELHREYAFGLLGTREIVLTEREENGWTTGHAKNYLLCRLPSGTPLDTLIPVVLKELLPDGTIRCVAAEEEEC